jgi:hypothetical protein
MSVGTGAGARETHAEEQTKRNRSAFKKKEDTYFLCCVLFAWLTWHCILYVLPTLTRAPNTL